MSNTSATAPAKDLEQIGSRDQFLPHLAVHAGKIVACSVINTAHMAVCKPSVPTTLISME